jgi:hypothetical protein
MSLPARFAVRAHVMHACTPVSRARSHLCEQPAWYRDLAPEQDEDEEEREGKLVSVAAAVRGACLQAAARRSSSSSRRSSGCSSGVLRGGTPCAHAGRRPAGLHAPCRASDTHTHPCARTHTLSRTTSPTNAPPPNRQMKLGAQLERMMTAVTGARNENEIQEDELPQEHQPDPSKVQLVDDDDGEWRAGGGGRRRRRARGGRWRAGGALAAAAPRRWGAAASGLGTWRA